MNVTELENNPEVLFEDSEAETEKLHSSPIKRRPSDADLDPKRRRTDPPLSPTIAPNQIPESQQPPQINTGPAPSLPPPVQPIQESEDEGDDQEVDADGDAYGDADQDVDAENMRMQALKSLTDIEIEFATLCDQIHDQQISRLDLEIELTHTGTHPQLARYSAQIDAEKELKLIQTQKLLSLAQQSISTQTHSQRVSAWQTFFKTKSDLRNQMIQEVTHKWFMINREFCTRDASTTPPIWSRTPNLSKATPASQLEDIQQIRQSK